MIVELFAQVPSAGLPGSQVPVSGDGTFPPRSANDPLGTVGLALLAYGLVQLLSKFIDKIGSSRSGGEQRANTAGSFGDEDRKRLERASDVLSRSDQLLQRIAESGATHQKLIGQVLDELRESQRRHDQLAHRLNAAWTRIGSRDDDAR